mmetsp:Transcript_34147/g.74350  ORF Transcript_34147/g.74350 Transcript_34147/m.74350 type:complete len:138 (+) Transcript_34147:25-438(+)
MAVPALRALARPLALGRGFPTAVTCRGAASSAIAERANSLVQEHGCIVFSKSTCPFCSMAKQVLLADLQAKCHIVDMDNAYSGADMAEMQDHFLATTGARSVPRVFIGGKCVGGGSDVQELHARGELKSMLEKAGAL